MQIGLVFEREVKGHIPKDPSPYGLIGYADSNFAKNLGDRNLVMEYYFFMNGAVVLWSSKKQRTVSTCITEADYIAFGYVAKEAVWIRRFINKINLEVVRDVTLHGNNEMSITLTKNTESQYQTKYINVQHHYIRELVHKKEFTVKWVPNSEMFANGMIKKLSNETFRKHQALLKMAIE